MTSPAKAVAIGNPHVLSRLGAAVVEYWEVLSSADRELILDQATFTADSKGETVQLRQELERFIREKRISIGSQWSA